MRSYFTVRRVTLRLSEPCFILLSAKAAQEGYTVASAVRRAINLHLEAAQLAALPAKRTVVPRQHLPVRFGRALWARLAAVKTCNRSALIERCAWIYLGTGDRFT